MSQDRATQQEVSGRYEKRPQATGLRYGIIESTTHCQFACPGCYMVTRDSLNKGAMSLTTAVRILDLCKKYCGRELETMDILGGEPLLWPYLKEYVEILLERGIKPWIFTNMLAITPELASWLREHEVHITGKLNVDPDDPSQISLQAKMIGCTESVARRMIAAIQVFCNAGYANPMFRLQNLVRRRNIAFIPAYYRWCVRNGIGVDLELMASGEPVDDEYFRIAPRPEEIAGMIRKVQEVRVELGLGSAEVLMPHVFGACPFYDAGLYFAVDGHIRSCSNSTAQLGHIDDPDPIRTAFESPLMCNRISLCQGNVGAPCNTCDRWDKCRGGCRATVEGLGNPFGGYPLCPVLYLG